VLRKNGLDDALVRMRADSLYSTILPYGVLAIGASLLLACSYWPHHQSPILIAWVTANTVSLPLRAAMAAGYRRFGREKPGPWVLAALLSMLLGGVIWGAGIGWMLAVGDPYEVTVASCISLGAICLAVSNLSYWQNHAVFQFPTLVLAAIGYIANGRPEYREVAAAAVMLAIGQVVVVRQLGRRLVDAMRVSIENELLAKDLTARGKELEAANAELERLSRCDGLTGLANRRHYDEVLRTEWTRAARSGKPLSLLAIDVDHFKSYNDTFGHDEGDVCLRAVGLAVQQSSRQGIDLAARPGGEEFTVILPDTDIEGAAIIAERIRATVAALNEVDALGLKRPVTVSIGAHCARPSDGESPQRLARMADERLYRAKAEGRDRVVAEPATARPAA